MNLTWCNDCEDYHLACSKSIQRRSADLAALRAQNEELKKALECYANEKCPMCASGFVDDLTLTEAAGIGPVLVHKSCIDKANADFGPAANSSRPISIIGGIGLIIIWGII